MTERRVIGLSGYARSGKDTLADFLVQEHGFERIAFADTLREAMCRLNPIVGVSKGGTAWRYNEVIEHLGYEAAKDSPLVGDEIRRLLQVIGTEVGRELLGENVWVEAALSRIEPGKSYVFTDMRFPNEAYGIDSLDGLLVRITRPGFGPANAHASETALDNFIFDHEIVNDGTLDELFEKAEVMLGLR